MLLEAPTMAWNSFRFVRACVLALFLNCFGTEKYGLGSLLFQLLARMFYCFLYKFELLFVIVPGVLQESSSLKSRDQK